MLRWLVRSLAAASLLPLVTVSLLWCVTRRSHQLWVHADESGSATILIAAKQGDIRWVCATGWPRPEAFAWRSSSIDDVGIQFNPNGKMERAFGVAWGNGRLALFVPVAGDARAYVIPPAAPFYLETTGPSEMWAAQYAPLFIATALPLAWVPRWTLRTLRARSRRRAGQCLSCGYDVRANGERCPECGATIVR